MREQVGSCRAHCFKTSPQDREGTTLPGPPRACRAPPHPTQDDADALGAQRYAARHASGVPKNRPKANDDVAPNMRKIDKLPRKFFHAQGGAQAPARSSGIPRGEISAVGHRDRPWKRPRSPAFSPQPSNGSPRLIAAQSQKSWLVFRPLLGRDPLVRCLLFLSLRRPRPSQKGCCASSVGRAKGQAFPVD